MEELMVMKPGGFEVELAMVESVDPVMVTGHETAMVRELAVMKLGGFEVDPVMVTGGKTPTVGGLMGMKPGGMERVMLEVAERVTARPEPKSYPAAETPAPCPCGRGCTEAERNEGGNCQPLF